MPTTAGRPRLAATLSDPTTSDCLRPTRPGDNSNQPEIGERPPFRRRGTQTHQPSISHTERTPLLRRVTFSHELNRDGPVFSCIANQHSYLPVYTNIHRIRRDVISIVEDYLTLDQLRDVRINVSVIRPLVDKLYELDDISIVYCLLVNRAHFLAQQSHLKNRQNVFFARATLCELVATRILRRFNEDNPGAEGLLVMAHVLVAGFEPFQNAPAETRRLARASTSYRNTLPALEMAILTESKLFLSSTSCQKVVDGIYEGRIIYTPSSFVDIIPDRYKQKPISLYDPREASLLNQYRLIVPRTRNILEILQFCILLVLYMAFMSERDASRFSRLELCFTVYAFGWVLDQFATMMEHGWHVYSQNLWSFLDVTFAAIYWTYLVLRLHGWRTREFEPGQQALDVLAIGAAVLIPRLAFNLLSGNLLFVSLRSMLSDFALLTALAGWCFLGFLLSLVWLGEGVHQSWTVMIWMIYIWFGLDGSGIARSTDFHWLLGPCLMVAFAFLGNTLFLTILVSMLSNTFSTIVSNATAEIQFRHSVLTLEGVKSDAIFAYQPPFNILALLVLVPLKFCVSPRWFHKIHVFTVRLLNLPLLLIIAAYERRLLWPSTSGSVALEEGTANTNTSPSRQHVLAKPMRLRKRRSWFWERWRITAHSDMEAVFELPLPDSVREEIAADDEMTENMIRRQYVPRDMENATNDPGKQQHASNSETTRYQMGAREGSSAVSVASSASTAPPQPQLQHKTSHVSQAKFLPSRRDSIVPFPGLRAEMRGILVENADLSDMTLRLDALEESSARVEELVRRLLERQEGAERDGPGTMADAVREE